MNDMTIAKRILSDGRVAEVFPLTFGRARLGVSRPERYGYTWDDEW
jgi:hypothetical protein